VQSVKFVSNRFPSVHLQSFLSVLFSAISTTSCQRTFRPVLFIYSIGLQAGPGFLRSLKSSGLKLTIGALGIIATGFLTVLTAAWIFKFDASVAAGLFAGALTSTPGLAVAVEMAGSAGAPAAYGLTYFFGVIGVILFVQLLPKLMKISIAEEEQMLNEEISKANLPFSILHIELTNPNIFGKQVKELRIGAIAPVVITRLLREGASEPELVGAETELKQGDHLRIIGRHEDLAKIQLFLGSPIEKEIEFDRVLTKKYILVSKESVVGMSIAQLNCRELFNVQISRITRNGIDLPVTKTLRLHMGDTLHAVGDSRSLKNLAKVCGDNVKELYSINLLPIFIGLFLGFVLGMIPLYLPFAGKFTLGTTGGVLVAGILLSNLYKTGPFIWEIPSTANSFIRELGLILFMATVGTKTGATILTTLSAHGAQLFFCGIAVTLIPLITAIIICRVFLKLPFLRMLGIMTGAMTSTPGLASVSTLSNTHYASSSYATVYPVALIGMILFTKLLVLILG